MLLINIEDFKLINGNAIKWLKMRQEMHKVTKTNKTVEAIFKQITNQKFQVKKKMQV